MNELVVVVGAGACGLAAAWRLADRGRDVLIVSNDGGATEWSSGALDVDLARSTRPLSEPARNFLQALGLFVPRDPESVASVVATSLGVVRGTYAAALGVLDLSPCAGAVVLIADPDLAGWDARALARSYSETAWALATGTRFEAVPLRGVFRSEELAYPLAAFSRVLNEPARARELSLAVARIRGERTDAAALLVGPWLGEPSTQVRELVNLPLRLGEVLHPPEATFGVRYAQARRELALRLGIARREGPVVGVRRVGSNMVVQMGGPDEPTEVVCGQLVMAGGGLLGGGVHLVPVEAGAQHGWRATPSLSAPSEISGELSGWDPTARPRDWISGSPFVTEIEYVSGIARAREPFWGHRTWGAAVECGCALAEHVLGTVT